MLSFAFFQTSLFQNKLLDSSNPSSILINTTTHSLSTDLTRGPSFFGDMDNAATLRDVNGNLLHLPTIYCVAQWRQYKVLVFLWPKATVSKSEALYNLMYWYYSISSYWPKGAGIFGRVLVLQIPCNLTQLYVSRIRFSMVVSEGNDQCMAALTLIPLMNFCKVTCHHSSSQACKNSSEKHSVLFLTFLLSVSKIWYHKD